MAKVTFKNYEDEDFQLPKNYLTITPQFKLGESMFKFYFYTRASVYGMVHHGELLERFFNLDFQPYSKWAIENRILETVDFANEICFDFSSEMLGMVVYDGVDYEDYMDALNHIAEEFNIPVVIIKDNDEDAED